MFLFTVVLFVALSITKRFITFQNILLKFLFFHNDFKVYTFSLFTILKKKQQKQQNKTKQKANKQAWKKLRNKISSTL